MNGRSAQAADRVRELCRDIVRIGAAQIGGVQDDREAALTGEGEVSIRVHAASICGTIVRSEAKRARSRRLTILDIVVEDSTGRLQAVFFNQPFLEQLFTVGTSVMLSARRLKCWLSSRETPL